MPGSRGEARGVTIGVTGDFHDMEAVVLSFSAIALASLTGFLSLPPLLQLAFPVTRIAEVTQPFKAADGPLWP
jgi:hypothetical protein